jgi:RHS repeat-associated protein
VAITSGTGTLTERLSYDPWGKRRNATTNAWSSPSPGSQLLPATLALLPRGYTSHEHLDKLGLIHMNGRVYDPELGRFLSADPLIQFPESTQGFDRYAYVGNSPLSYTDPSGHGLLGIVGSIVSFFYPPVGALLIAVDGYLEGGLQGALFSVASMAAAAGVGDMFGHAVGTLGNELARAAVHGLIQGALSAAQGGKFGAAFLAAGVTSGYGSSGLGQIGNRVTRVISAAVLGGTVSKIGGGKFANGAVTGAFVQAFGRAAEGEAVEGGYGEGGARDRSVYAAEDGSVETLGWENKDDPKQGYGYRLKLRADGDKSLFVYGHLDPNSLTVAAGDAVTKGQFLGIYADPTNGSATGPHLHFEWWSAKGGRLDPAPYRSVVMPGYAQSDFIRFRGVHPVKGTPNWHNGYDLVGPMLQPSGT